MEPTYSELAEYMQADNREAVRMGPNVNKKARLLREDQSSLTEKQEDR
jgi:hypothetical protein